MQRYFAVNEKLELLQSDKHHIVNVMRMKKDETFLIVWNKKVFLCKLNNSDIKNLKYEVVREIKEDNELKINITIAFSLVNETKTDLILQKCTELGVNSFIPIITERSKIKLNNKEDKKLVRWKKIVKEAAEQSHRNIIPEIHDICLLKDIINYDADKKILCSTKEKEKNVKNVLQNSTKCDTIIIVTGPEGGISENEELFLNENNYISASLGTTILRTETAPIFAVSAIKYEYMR